MPKLNWNVYQSLALIGQFGINMLVPVFVCSFLGMFLDKKLGTSCFVIVLFFIGAAAGFRNIYRFSKRIFNRQSSESAYLHEGRKKQNGTEVKSEEMNYESSHNQNEQDII